MGFVSQTIEKMLATKEDTLNILKGYDLVLICSWEGNYFVMDIFQLTKFDLSDRENILKQNTPFYSAARSLHKRKEILVYLDEHKEKAMGIKNFQAFIMSTIS